MYNIIFHNTYKLVGLLTQGIHPKKRCLELSWAGPSCPTGIQGWRHSGAGREGGWDPGVTSVELLWGKNPPQSIFLSPPWFFSPQFLLHFVEAQLELNLESILLRWVFLYIYNIALLQIMNSFPSFAASST